VTAGKSEYVQGLTLEECATLLNIDVADKELMEMVYDTAFAIKNRIYGNRIVLFAPLYIANYCVNSCTYCAFRAGNKNLQVWQCARCAKHNCAATDRLGFCIGLSNRDHARCLVAACCVW